MRLAFNVQDIKIANDRGRDELWIDIEVDACDLFDAIESSEVSAYDKDNMRSHCPELLNIITKD